MRFFDSNVLARYRGGTIAGTSGNASTAFSETIDYSYISSGQDTDGDEVILNRTFESEQELDALVILNHNFANLTIWTKETAVSSFVNVTPIGDNVIVSNDSKHTFYKWSALQKFFEIEFRVSNTSPANQEKTCSAIMGFEEIGNLYIFNKVTTTRKAKQKVLKLDAGGVVVVNKGHHWQFNISSKYIGVQEQYDIIQTIQNMGRDFFIWINSGYESQKVDVEPYRFEDFVKCTHTGNPKPSAHKNYLNSVFNDGIKFEQTGQIK